MRIVGTMSLFDSDNNKVCEFDNLERIGYLKTMDENPTSDDVIITCNSNKSATINLNAYKIDGFDLSTKQDSYTISYTKSVQAKKHKKKRINKKWLKKYGYKNIVVNSDRWEVNCCNNNEYEFKRSKKDGK